MEQNLGATANPATDEQHVMTEAHTPTPWVYEGAMNSDEIRIGPQKYFDYEGKRSPVPMQDTEAVCTLKMKHSGAQIVVGASDEQEANAAFIVRAVNAHDDLVKALELLLHEVLEAGFSQAADYGWPKAISTAKAALADSRAKGAA